MKIQCSKETFELLAGALAKAAEDNKVSTEEFLAFIFEFPRLMAGDKFKDIIFVPEEKK